MDQALRHRAQCGDVGEVHPRIAGNTSITDAKR
jgi:chorismate synthase